MDGGGGGDGWLEVGRRKSYTPSIDDVGHTLKLECVPVDITTGLPVSAPSTLPTSRVIPAPSPIPRRLVSIGEVLGPQDGVMGGKFSLLSYNVLSDLYATSEMYSYCPSWALSWAYRRQNLLRELLNYQADIMCLQEVRFRVQELWVRNHSSASTRSPASNGYHRLSCISLGVTYGLQSMTAAARASRTPGRRHTPAGGDL